MPSHYPRPDRLDPTPPEVFFSRRSFLRTTSAATAASIMPMSCLAANQSIDGEADPAELEQARKLTPPFERPEVFPPKRREDYMVPAAIDRSELTPRETAATHNNFYEFLPNQGGPVWELVDLFEVDPWQVEITGECNQPTTLDLDDLFKISHEERIYHFRCVERWAMNVPWSGFPLSKLLEKVEPTDNAKFVRFVSAHKPNQMPGITSPGGRHYPWPYFEALRMDEAMHDLTMVVTGVYGKPLLKQHGAPVRIIVPWKYGYKSPKSIVKIELVREQPETFWHKAQPHEYGFLSNVNPNIPHPRWSQQRSYWLDRRQQWFETPIFNGYGEQVAYLYPDEPMTLQEPLREGQNAR